MEEAGDLAFLWGPVKQTLELDDGSQTIDAKFCDLMRRGEDEMAFRSHLVEPQPPLRASDTPPASSARDSRRETGGRRRGRRAGTGAVALRGLIVSVPARGGAP